MNIRRGKLPGARKYVLYGVEGIGKSTFAAKFPDPIFIDTEDSTKEMDVARFDKPSSWEMLLQEVQYVVEHPDICKTLVIDTIDWAEKLCIKSVCARYQKSSIEAFDYGKGYTITYETFGGLLNLLGDVTEKGISVLLIGHATTKRQDLPEEFGSYDRWGLNLIDSPKCSNAKMVREWTDVLLFANYKTLVVAADDKGKKHKAQGGKRVMYTSHHPCWDAKNRLGLPEEMPLDYTPLAGYFSSPAVQTEEAPKEPAQPKVEPAEYKGNAVQPALKTVDEPAPLINLTGVPAVLAPLMLNDGVTEGEVRQTIVNEGYFTRDTPWKAMEESGFVDGWLVPNWSYIVYRIKESRGLPF